MITGSIDPLGNEAIDFFEDMGYEFVQIENYAIDSLCGTKKLQKRVLLVIFALSVIAISSRSLWRSFQDL